MPLVGARAIDLRKQEVMVRSRVAEIFCHRRSCAGEGRLDYLKLLLDAYRQGREAAGKKCGDKQTARLLNKRNLHGQTPLMLACKYG